MNCRRVVNLLSAHIDGELTGEEMLAIRWHISHCDECAQEHRLLCMTKQAVANLRTTFPREELARSIIMQLDEVQIPRYQKYISSIINVMQQKLSPVAAALAVSGIALAILSAGPIERVAPIASANSDYVAVSQMSLLPEPRSTVTSLSAAQPLKLANESPDFGNARLELASIMTR